MRFKGFVRRSSSGELEAVPFAESHYREAGLGYTPAAGMPMLEAYQLVNKWNLQQQRFVFCL